MDRARVLLDALLEEARDRALRRPDGAVQENDAPLRAVAFRGGLEHVHEAHQRDVEAEDRVGAAVLADGVQHLGCNIENASYGLTMCAERVALYNGIAAGHRAINALAVNCLDANVSEPIGARMPCGACRQVMKELLQPQAPIVIIGVGIFFVDELLPFSFFLSDTTG